MHVRRERRASSRGMAVGTLAIGVVVAVVWLAFGRADVEPTDAPTPAPLATNDAVDPAATVSVCEPLDDSSGRVPIDTSTDAARAAAVEDSRPDATLPLTLRVTVIDAAGRPKPGATVWFESTPSPSPSRLVSFLFDMEGQGLFPLWRDGAAALVTKARTERRAAVTDDGGVASLVVPRHNLHVFAQIDDALGWSMHSVDAVEASVPCVVTVSGSAPLTLVVVDASGRPAAGVELAAIVKHEPDGDGRRKPMLILGRIVTLGVTDADGRRTIHHPQLLRKIPGFRTPPRQRPTPIEVAPRLLGMGTFRWQVDIEAIDPQPRRLTLPPTGTVEVVLDDGVTGTSRWLRVGIDFERDTSRGRPDALQNTITLPVPTQWPAIVPHVGLGEGLSVGTGALVGRGDGPKHAGERARLVLREMPRQASVIGRVVDADGMPMRCDAVRLRTTAPGGLSWETTQRIRGTDGTFAIPIGSGLAGRVATGGRLRLMQGVAVVAEIELAPFTLPQTNDHDLGTLRVELLPVLVEGRVTLDGKPATDAIVVVATRAPGEPPREANTDADGRFTIRGRFAGGSLSIHARAPLALSTAWIAVAAGTRDVTLALVTGRALDVLLVLPRTEDADAIHPTLLPFVRLTRANADVSSQAHELRPWPALTETAVAADRIVVRVHSPLLDPVLDRIAVHVLGVRDPFWSDAIDLRARAANGPAEPLVVDLREQLRSVRVTRENDTEGSLQECLVAVGQPPDQAAVVVRGPTVALFVPLAGVDVTLTDPRWPRAIELPALRSDVHVTRPATGGR